MRDQNIDFSQVKGKKVPKTILVLIFLLFFFSGCTEQFSSGEEKISLTVWECFKFDEHEEFLKIIAQFEEKYQKETGKKIEIIAKRVPFDDFETNIRLAALGNRTPDVACFDALKVLEFAFHRTLVPLDTLANFEAESISAKGKEYMKGAFQTNVIDIKGETHLYGLPQQTTCLALFWSRQMFREKASELEAAGLDPKSSPRTWEELYAYAKVLTDTENKEYGFAMDNSLWFTLPFFGCYNVNYIQSDAQGNKICTLGDPLSCAALQVKVDLYQNKLEAGAWKPGAISPEIGFANGKYAMILMGPWNIKRYRDTGIDFGISLIPRISRTKAIEIGLISPDASEKEYLEKAPPATNVGGNNMSIFKSCSHPEIAYDLINYISQTQAQLQWCKALNQIPVNVAAAEALRNDAGTNTDIKVFMKQALYSTAPPQIPRYGYLENDIMNPEMELALKGNKSVKEALQDAAKKINERILEPLNQ